MSDFKNAHRALLARILEGDGRASRVQRRGAFDNSGLGEPMSILVTKVAKQPTSVTDENFIMALTSGLSEDQIFEMAVAAAIGQATRQYNTALAALDAAAEEE